MQQNDDVILTLSRARSFIMRQTLSLMNISANTLTFAGNEYRIIDSDFRNWISADKQKLASIGGKVFGREILLINPYEGNVATLLNNYRLSLLHKHLMSQEYTPQYISNILEDICIYVSQLLNPNAAAVQKIIDTHKINPAQCLISNNNSVPYIDLEIFLAEKVGVCRHYAVLCCLISGYIMSKNILPSGQIILERSNLLNSAHACMHFVNNNNHWIIDPTKCLNRATANNAVTLIDHQKFDKPSTPTQPLTPPDNSSPASQSCDAVDAWTLQQIIHADSNVTNRQGR
jgi:hypothetical protein